MTSQIENRAAKIESALDAKGFVWTVDLADMIRDEVAEGLMVRRTTRDMTRRVINRLRAA